MTLSSTSTTLLVAWYVIGSIVGTIALASLAVVIRRLDTRLAELETRIDPLIRKADTVLSDVESKAQHIGDTSIRIIDKADSVAGTIEKTTETSSRLVRRALYTPLVEVNAVVYGVAAGFISLLRPQTTRTGKGSQ